MATEPITPEFPLDIREQLARLDRNQAEIDKWRMEAARTQAEVDKWRVEMAKVAAETAKAAAEADKTRLDIKLAPWAAVFTGLGAGAALFAAGAAFTKLVLG